MICVVPTEIVLLMSITELEPVSRWLKLNRWLIELLTMMFVVLELLGLENLSGAVVLGRNVSVLVKVA